MASVFMPVLRDQGVASTFVSAQACHLPAPAMIVFCSSDQPGKFDAIVEVANKAELTIRRRLSVENPRAKGTLLVFEPKELLDTSAFWKAVGIPQKSLAKVEFDASSSSSMERAFGEQRVKFARAVGVRKDFFDPKPIGLSRFGCRVVDTPLGRVAIHDHRVVTHREWELGPDGRPKGNVRDFFLRATLPDELLGCALGTAKMMLLGKRFTHDTFTRLYEAVVPAELREQMPFTQWHEDVEGACVSQMIRALDLGRAPRHVAQLLNDRLPNRNARSLETSRYDQFSTPLTVAAAAAAILAPQAGENVLEPMIGNGVLVSGVAALGATVTGVEIDPTRAARARAVLGERASVVEMPFERWAAGPGQGQRYDLVMANPPFSTDFKPRIIKDDHGREVRLARADHFYAYEALRQMKDGGRAFIIIAADKMGEGRLDGARRQFDNILRSTFHIAGSAVLDGRMYVKMGTQFPVQMYAVGPRREIPLSVDEAVATAPEEIPVLRTVDELQGWADRARDNMAALLSAANPKQVQPPTARTDLRGAPLADGSSRPVVRWDDRVIAASVEDAFGALAAGKVLALGDGSAARIEATASGWTLLLRDPTGVFTRMDDQRPVGAGWTRDQAIFAGLQEWGRQQHAAPVPAPAPTQAPGTASAAPGSTGPSNGDAQAASAPAGRSQRKPRRSAAPSQERAPEAEEPTSTTDVADAPVVEPGVGTAPVPMPPSMEEMAGILARLSKSDAPAELVDDPDPFILPYQSVSQVGEATTFIQRSLASATMQALASVERRYGNLDELVAQRFGFDRATMGTRLSPEQVDALAMAIAAADRRHGFLNADLMGVGKGRFFAAHVARGLMLERPVVFLSDRPDLFQDLIARDLCDVTGMKPSDLPAQVRPFIVNNTLEGRIFDYNAEGGPTLLFRHDATIASKARSEGAIPATVNMVMCSYSQFSHKGGDWKAEAIMQWMRNSPAPPILLIDEAQRAAGESSRCGALVTALVNVAFAELGGDVNYGSGTPLKSMRNIGVYKPILPDVGMSMDQLQGLVEANPLAMQEALSFEMARSGTFMSRELDQQGVRRQFVNLIDLNRGKYEVLTGKINQFSAFLGEMLEKSGEVNHTTGLMIKALQQEEIRAFPERVIEGKLASQVAVSQNSPASRFHTISQYMMFALKANFAEELVLTAIAQGKKPLLVVENVGDSMVEYMMDAAADGSDDEASADPAALPDERRLARLPNLGDLLIRTANNMLTVRARNGFGVVGKERLEEHEDWLEGFKDRVLRADFSDLSTSGIDQIRDRLARFDFRGGELTRRRFEIHKAGDGYEVVPRAKTNIPQVVRQFNDGEVDYAIMNRAASTGSSLHASPRTGDDLRPRIMIKLQLQSEITQERQIDGRIHRTGQVVPGEYMMPMSGLAADDRLMALFNGKNRSMTAASQASRDNATNIMDAPDILNPIGDKVVFAYLTANPALAARFGLNSEDLEPEGVARKFLGRMIVLPADYQASLMAEIETSFRLMVADLEAKGENPLRLNRYDWGASVEEYKRLRPGDELADAMADKPLTLNKISFAEKIRPLKWAQLMERIESVREKWSPDGRFVGIEETFSELVDIRVTGDLDWSAGIFDRALNRTGGMGSLGLEIIPSALAAETFHRRSGIDKPNGVQKAIFDNGDRAYFLSRVIEFLEPGKMVGLNPEIFPPLKDFHFYSHWGEGHESDAVVVPAVVRQVWYSEEVPLNLGNWQVELAIPGEAHGYTISLGQVFSFEREAVEREQKAKAEGDYVPSALPPSFFVDRETTIRKLGLGYNDDHAAELRDIRTSSASEEERAAATLKSFFERIPAGDIVRNRYTLEGNIFIAVALATQKRLGPKIIYTSDSGEIRHAVLLKNDKISKMVALLDEALQERASPAPAIADVLHGALSSIHALESFCMAQERLDSAKDMFEAAKQRHGEASAKVTHGYTVRTAEQNIIPLRAALVQNLAAAAGRPGDDVEIGLQLEEKLGEAGAVERWLPQLLEQTLAAARAPAMVSLGLKVGGDDLKGPLVGMSLTVDGGLRLAGAVNGTAMGHLARAVAADRSSAVVAVTPGSLALITHAKGQVVAEVPNANFRKELFKPRLPAGLVGAEMRTIQAFEDLVSYAKAERKEFSVHGPVRAVYEVAQDIGRVLRRDLEADLLAQKAATREATMPEPAM